MKVRGSRRLVKRLGLALAVAAVFAPAAQAVQLDPESREVVAAPARAYADDLVAPAPYSAISPQQGRQFADDRHEATPVTGISPQHGRRYADDRHEATPVTGGSTVVPQPVSKVVVDDSTSFNWGDAGIGAAVSFGLMLLGGGAIVAGRHTRRSRLAAA